MQACKRLAVAALAIILCFSLISCGELDKSELGEILSREYDSSHYTETSYQNYLKFYQEALDVYNNPNTTAYRIETVTVNLLSAIDDLVTIADFSQLLAELAEEINPMMYTTSSYQVYKTIYDSAMIIASNELSKQSVVNNAVRNLKTAKKALVPKTDTTELGELLKQEFVAGAYTASSYATYQLALESAKVLMYDDNVSESDVRLAVNGLRQAINGLVPLGSTLELENMISMVEHTYFEDNGMVLPAERYSKTTLENLRNVVASAKIAIANNDTSEYDVQSLTTEINQAVLALVDKLELLQSIMRMDSYLEIQTKYTSISFDNYLIAVTRAMLLNSKDDPTKDEIDAAVKAILDAENALVRKPVNVSGRNDFVLNTLQLNIYGYQTTVGAYFADYTDLYNRIFDSMHMIEQLGGSSFLLSDGYSITLVQNILTITDIQRAGKDSNVTIGGIDFTMDEYAVSEILGDPGEFNVVGNCATLVYSQISQGLRISFAFTAGSLDSVIIESGIYY